MRQKLVLDCSMTAAWLLSAQATLESKRLLDDMEKWQPIVPSIWETEIANVMLVQIRRSRISVAEAIEFLNFLKQFQIQTYSVEREQIFGSVFSLGRQFDLSSYDALYLHLALSESAPIATLEEKLLKAAKACGVEQV